METHRDPRQLGWRSFREDHHRALIDEAADDDVESRHEDFIDAGHRVLVHTDADLGGPRGFASLHDMRVEAHKVHLLRLLVLVVTAILAAYIYTVLYAVPAGQPGVLEPRVEREVMRDNRGSGTPVEGRSLSGEEATISLLVYALIEAANRQGNGAISGEGR